MELTIEQALQQGVAAHKEGKLQDAERLYRAILQSQPADPDANHNLGVIAVSINKADAALPLFKSAASNICFWLVYFLTPKLIHSSKYVWISLFIFIPFIQVARVVCVSVG